jgi:RimJ/RimL family protein N-acetyltransferase
MSPTLRTSRLTLNAFTAEDAAVLHELLADPRTHTIGSGPFTELPQTQRWIAERVATQRDQGLCWYALRCLDTGLLIGTCGVLKGRATFTDPQIGYLIRRSHQGQGYATEAALAVLDECRAAGLSRVWATIRPHNTASRRIARRLGMRVQRTETDDRGDLLFHVVHLTPDPSTSSGR